MLCMAYNILILTCNMAVRHKMSNTDFICLSVVKRLYIAYMICDQNIG